MAKRITMALLALVCTTVAGAAPLDRQSIPGSARWVLHIDGQAFWASQLGQHIVSGLDPADTHKRNAVKELMGSDIIDDLHGITLYGPSQDDKLAVTLVRGKFNPKKMLALIALNPEYSVSDSRSDREVHRWSSEKDKKAYHGTFINPNLIAISQSSSALGQAVDLLTVAPEAAGGSQRFQMIAGAPDSAFLVACAEDLDQLSQENEKAAILQNAKVLAFIGHEDAGYLTVTVRLETQGSQTAKQVEAMVQGLLAFARLQEKPSPGVASLLDSLNLTSEENVVQLKIRHPSAAIYELIQKVAKEKVHQSLKSMSQ